MKKDFFKNILIYSAIISAFIANFSLAAVKEETFAYKDGSTVLEGFVAYPEGVAKAPGVILVHDWKGLGDYVKSRARQIAELGYVAFAADIYGKGVRPQTADEAKTQATLYKGDPKKLRSRMNAALKSLKGMKQVNTSRVAALGYCFGGTSVLELARSGAKVNGVISFHGGLSSKAPLTKKGIHSRILVLHGADDPHVPAAEIAAFENEMRTAGADWQLHAYGNAVHSFSNPAAGNDNSTGNAYNAAADKRSFQTMVNFLAEIFN